MPERKNVMTGWADCHHQCSPSSRTRGLSRSCGRVLHRRDNECRERPPSTSICASPEPSVRDESGYGPATNLRVKPTCPVRGTITRASQVSCDVSGARPQPHHEHMIVPVPYVQVGPYRAWEELLSYPYRYPEPYRRTRRSSYGRYM